MSDRSSMSGSHDCGGDAAAYALGALEPHEVDDFRRHMMQCAVCRDEVESLAGVVAALPLAARQYETPKGLGHRVMREIQREPSLAERAAARAPRRRLGRAGALRPGVRGWVAGAAAALATAGGAVAAIELSAGVAATVIQAQVSGVSGSAELRVAGGHGELVVRHLTPPGAGHIYEVWLQPRGGSPVPASVLFDVNSGGGADVGIPRNLRGVSAVMVTQEPLGGTPRPTHNPVIVARID
jgi:hypothetical protein